MTRTFILLAIGIFSLTIGYTQQQTLDSGMHFIRNAEEREWATFPAIVEKRNLVIRFEGAANAMGQTLSLRQYDVKQNWRIRLNDHDLGSLVTDEKDMITYYQIPPQVLRNGENVLEIKCKDVVSDDIKVGQVFLDTRPLQDVLSEAVVDIEIADGATGALIPSHITIVNEQGVLQTVTSPATEHLAMRPGHVYTASGKATLLLPAGIYTLYANRGFEYSVDSIRLNLARGDHHDKKFLIRREVDTEGWISCDTHIHTFTHSGHGDANDRERVITIAGEGLELPIITDHNIHVDLKPETNTNNVHRYFTPVTGNEVTTSAGHFNVFPVAKNETVINHNGSDWKTLDQNIRQAPGLKAIILNHGRDVHKGFRPFDSTRYLAPAGMRIDREEVFANAMEVINSGSQQTDIMRLFNDWFGMLNRGYFLTPVGSSDSHDVSRFIVGQGRTYIKCEDKDAGNIQVDEAVESFLEGKVMVSLGLLTSITVNDVYGPGDLVRAAGKVNVSVKVMGPAWTTAERVSLYANGKKIREVMIEKGDVAGLKWTGTWELELQKQDVFLVAIAEGPAGKMPWWPIAKPYQPASPVWRPHVMGATSAILIDADKNGERTSAYAYGKIILEKSNGNSEKVMKMLRRYDEAVAAQVAALLWERGTDLKSAAVTKALSKSSPAVKSGFESVIKELYMD